VQKFTDRYLSKLTVEVGKKDRLVFDEVCPGLGVRVTVKGTKNFLAQWTDPVTRRKVRDPIGVWGNITIEQARYGARMRLGAVAKGIDPKAERLRMQAEAQRERAESALTFEALILEWRVLHLARRRPRYAAEAERAIRCGLPDLLNRPAARISRTDAFKALQQIVDADKAVTAGRTMAYARACFAWGKKNDKVRENPFAGLSIDAGATERERTLSDTEITQVWGAADTLGYPFGPFYKLAILTLQRRAEIAGLRWSELDDPDDPALWVIPGSRMKNGKPHDVHLSEPARAVLRSVPRVHGCDLVFSTTTYRLGGNVEPHGKRKSEPMPISGFSQGKRYLDAMIKQIYGKPIANWRLHDLRRTGVTTLAMLSFDSIVVDKLLAHQPTKLRGVARVYQRHEFAKERAVALDAWASHVTGDPADNVVAMARVRV
jgi:integrase